MSKFEKHILVVDDDDRIRELVKQYLEENSFLVTTAKNADDAKEKLEIIKFDILVLDIMMPGQSGLSLTKDLKKNYKDSLDLKTNFTDCKDVKNYSLTGDLYEFILTSNNLQFCKGR